MASGSAIRGTRVGSSPTRPVERCEPAARRPIIYYCANAHSVEALFAADAPPPATWDCPKCGLPAGRDPANPPDRPRAEPYKTHLAYVKERRTEEDGAAILAEALDRLRQRRGD